MLKFSGSNISSHSRSLSDAYCCLLLTTPCWCPLLSLYNTRECSTRVRTIFGRGGGRFWLPILDRQDQFFPRTKTFVTQFWKSRLSFHLLQSLNSRHPATPYNGQFSRSQLYASNTQRPRFSGHSSTFSARLSTIAAVVNNLTLD